MSPSEVQLQAFFQQSADAMVLMENGCFTACNAMAVSMMGFSDEQELLGLTPLDISPEYQPDGRRSVDKVGEITRRTLEDGSYRFEWLNLLVDGTTLWVEVVSTLIFHEDKAIINAVWRDISKRKAVEAASQKYQERLGLLMQQTPVAIIEWSSELAVIGWNPAAEKIFGYTAAEMIGGDVNQFIPESERVSVGKVIAALMAKRGGRYSLNKNNRKDGTIIICEWINTALRDVNDNVVGVFSMVQDVTERERTRDEILNKSQALEQALQDLKNTQLQLVQGEKMASLGTLMAGIAHEINNPIGFLNGSIKNAEEHIEDLFEYLETYHEHQPPTEPVQDAAEDLDLDFLLEDLPVMLTSMQRATNRIKSISRSLRIFSRTDTEDKILADVHEGLDSTLLILKFRLRANETRPEVEVIKHYCDDFLEIYCFPGQLNQVLMNLLANAIDAFDEVNQGRSFEEIQANPNRIVIETETVDDAQLQIRIQDNGCGMTPEVQERLFDQGFTTKAVGKGTGLGMAIAHQIITEKHGGTLTCTSEAGKGSTFTITLPTN